ncbi:DUF488 domain-containing protein [Bordetella genomosp. 9]|uniref:MarR family transcriptional regulator n=1 Tax=Bordetella genomosp. 9 TaxID=1416803 RepID=A0A1W6Z2H5_9BORD|nr:DUF488 family protein [Bordetella genomosp. 9]ARP87506.1 hypothetical protein CAL13_15810 [Bordetella genomosp. 9]
MATRHPRRAIRLQRVYGEQPADRNYRVLVDRFWPRGRTKAGLGVDLWARELAPTPELIKWFGHVPERWDEFRSRYLDQLSEPEREDAMRRLLEAAGGRDITLLFGARDEHHNQAVVLREALLRRDAAEHDTSRKGR